MTSITNFFGGCLNSWIKTKFGIDKSFKMDQTSCPLVHLEALVYPVLFVLVMISTKKYGMSSRRKHALKRVLY
jgi:hypothetical protein